MNRFRNILRVFFLLAGVILLFRVIHTCERFEPERELYFYTDTIIAQAARGSYLFSGAVVHTGKDEITEHGFCWSHSGGPTLEEDTAVGLGPLSEPDSFAVTVTGLDAGTTYFVRCFVTTGEGTVYSEDKSFTTPGADLPEVTTSAVTHIGQDSAQSGGTVTDDGGDSITARGVCWDTTASPTIAANHTTDGTGSGTFTSAITGLSPATLYHVRAYATNARGTAYGNDVSFTTLTGPGSTVADYDGNVYPTVQIGEQVWMAENLKTTHYADGSAILLVEGNTDWDNLTPSDKAYCWYDNSTANRDIYGGLYTWAAAMNGAAGSNANPSGVQGVCPDGWHLPSDAEWKEMEIYLGMLPSTADNTGLRGSEGGKLKEAGETHWNSPNTGATNESGFTALPAGYRHSSGTFAAEGFSAFFWTAAQSDISQAWHRELYYDGGGVYRTGINMDYGYSVRCVQGEGSSATKPTVTTTTISNITENSAEGGGEVTDDGGAIVTARGVCWDTTASPTVASSHTTGGTGTGTFTSVITGLSPATLYHVRAYATNSQGTAYGDDLSFTTLTGPGSTVTDYDGNVYPTVQIGEQVWMAENLKVTHYADGSAIPLVEGTTEWDNLTPSDKAYCWYDNSTANRDTYGGLYTWAGAMNGAAGSSANPSGVQGVCPDGWHLPSDAEWTELTDYLGGSGVAGGKLKEAGTAHWASPNSGATNESGFTALPGGSRGQHGTFDVQGSSAYFWSSTENDPATAWLRLLGYDNAGVGRFYIDNLETGCSVRCVRNE
jgi:uncharacterized protein (TIGR02145 family)